jgi:WD40-like Beta Propeller Repeat
MVRTSVSSGLLLLLSGVAIASGPADRTATDPKSVMSETKVAGKPVPVPELLQTVRLGGASWSPDGQTMAFVGNASGRLNLWVMGGRQR